MARSLKTIEGAGHCGATIHDVARDLGVSKSTVSAALSGHGRIAPATRHRVLRAARRLNYQPNPHARNLSTGQSTLVGLLSVATFPGIHTHIVEVMQDTLTQHGFDVPLYGFGHRSLKDVDYQYELVVALRRQRPLAIVCHFTPHLGQKAFDALTEFVSEGGVLVGYGDPRDMPCDYVAIDYDDFVVQSTRHLIALGHRRIGLFVPSLTAPHETRPAAFCRVMRENGIAPRKMWMFDGAAFEEGGAGLARQFLELRERPTALDIINDQAASIFIGAMVRAGIRVPEDVSVVGHDDAPVARYGNPALTTVAHPVEAVAKAVIEFLIGRLEGGYDGTPRMHVVRGQLMVRESTSSLRDA